MKRLALLSVWLALPLAIAGCGPYKVSVFAKNGTAYTAPSLCQALLVCLQTEPVCYYDRNLMQTATGATEVEECKEVKK